MEAIGLNSNYSILPDGNNLTDPNSGYLGSRVYNCITSIWNSFISKVYQVVSDFVSIFWTSRDVKSKSSVAQREALASEHLCKEIFKFAFSSYDLRIPRLVNKEWNRMGRDLMPFVQEEERKKIYETVALGKATWNRAFGERIVEGDDLSSLRSDIGTILASPCPVFPGRNKKGELIKVRDTHMLVYLPESINLRNAEGVLQRVPFTLRNLGLLMRPKLQGSANGFRYMPDTIAAQEGNKSLGESRWVLMTKDVLLKSRCKTYNEQKEIVRALPGRGGMAYGVPGLLETAACIYVCVASGEESMVDDMIYMRCNERVIEGYQVTVGGRPWSAGLEVYNYRYYPDNVEGRDYFDGILGVAVALR